MKSLVKLSMALCLAVICTACNRQKTVAENLDEYFNAVEDRFMGSVTVITDGRNIYQRHIGFSDVENHVPATDDTRYHIGSISKTFTALLVLLGEEEGVLSLDETIEKYFHDMHIPNADIITIDHLLQHRSGLVDIIDDLPADYMTWYTMPQTREQMVGRIAAAGTHFEPDSAFRYCNAGYILLTYILEDVYAKPFAELLEEKITRPAGLEHTSFTSQIDTRQGDALSYNLIGEWVLASETQASVALGAGALTSTTSDLVKFATALNDGFFGDRIIEKMKQMKDGYGRGLMDISNGENKGFGHTGGIDGFVSLMAVLDNSMVVFCSNGMDRTINVINDVLEIANGHVIELPVFEEGPSLDDTLLDSYVGRYHIESIGLQFDLIAGKGHLFIDQMGQIIPLKTLSDSTFGCSAAGLEIIMDAQGNSLTMKQNGMDFHAERR